MIQYLNDSMPQSVLRRALRWGRSRASGELLQAIAFVARRRSNRSIVLRQFHVAVRHLESIRIFSLRGERQCETENHGRLGATRERVDGLLKILLRCRIILLLELNGTETRIRARP